MAEEEDNQVSPQSNDFKGPESTSGSPNDNTIEEVINQGVYGLTGVDLAVSKPNDEISTDQNTQSINPQDSNALDENNNSDSDNNENNSQLQNQTDSNSEGIAANAGEDENDSANKDQSQGDLESLSKKLGGLLNENQEEAENEEEEEEEEEEAEDAEDQNDQTVQTSKEPEAPNETENTKNELNHDNSIENTISIATDSLLNQVTNNNNDSNEKEFGELSNLPTDIGNALLPDEPPNSDEDNTGEKDNNNTNEAEGNIEDDHSKSNENQRDENDNDDNNDENKSGDENNNENDENKNDDSKSNENDENKKEEENNDDDNSTDGMMVHDEFKDSYSNWKGSTTPKIPGTTSVSHLPPLETTPELDSLSKRILDRFEQRGKLPDPEHYAQVLQYIQRQKINSVVSNDFVSAGRYQTLSQKFIAAINSTQVNQSQKKKLDLLEVKLEQTNNQLRDFQYETDQLLKNERYRLTDKRAQLVNIHQETLNNFEDQWNDEGFLIKYARPSSKLLQTKKIERSFVLVKDFEGAENCRKKVAELEKLESQQAQKRARSEMEKQYKKLTSKQEAEIEAFDENARSQLELMSKDRSSQLEKLVARQSKLQSQIVEIKNPGRQSWASASGPTPIHSSSKGGSSLGTSLPSLPSGKSSQLENLMTPRTIQRYALFKTTMKKPKLTVKPLGTINQKKKKPVQAPKF